MPASDLGAAGILVGVSDFLAHRTKDIIRADPVLYSLFEKRVAVGPSADPLPGIPLPQCVVAVEDKTPEARIGGMGGTVSITTIYSFNMMRRALEPNEPSAGGVASHHINVFTNSPNHFLDPGNEVRLVEGSPEFQTIPLTEIVSERSVVASVVLIARYRERTGAYQTLLDHLAP